MNTYKFIANHRFFSSLNSKLQKPTLFPINRTIRSVNIYTFIDNRRVFSSLNSKLQKPTLFPINRTISCGLWQLIMAKPSPLLSGYVHKYAVRGVPLPSSFSQIFRPSYLHLVIQRYTQAIISTYFFKNTQTSGPFHRLGSNRWSPAVTNDDLPSGITKKTEML